MLNLKKIQTKFTYIANQIKTKEKITHFTYFKLNKRLLQ